MSNNVFRTTCEQVLKIRLAYSQAATKKFDAIADKAYEGRMLETLQPWGASRTGRWAGRGLQVQNLKRPTMPCPEVAADLLVEDPGLFARLYTLEDLGSLVRLAIKAPEGCRLVVADLASIESRVLGWLSRCNRINQVFATGRDAYKDFASRWFHTPYDEVTRAQRVLAKPAVLGCFSAETLVLTDTGWKPIIRIHNQDQLWDGEQWVANDGVIYRGMRRTITQHGVTATPDHLILVEKNRWAPWSALAGGNYRQAINLASGALSSSTVITGSANAPAAFSDGCRPTTSRWEKAVRACVVRTVKRWRHAGIWLKHWGSRLNMPLDWLIGTTPYAVDVATPLTPVSFTTEGGASNADLRRPKTLCGIFSPFPGGISRRLRSTASTTTGITNRGTCGLPTAGGTRPTLGSTASSSTTGDDIPRPDFGANMRPPTVMPAPLGERSARGFPPSKSLQTRATAEVPTYDVLNAGPNNRFTIWTEGGPVLAHNCGYGLGGTGLLKYAESMGVELTEEEALESVGTWRRTYPEVPRYWSLCEERFKAAVMSPGTKVGSMVYEPPFLKWQLPSGRFLWYFEPEIDSDNQISFMGQTFTGQWARISTWGGKLTENVVQAVARDVLVEGLRRASLAGLDIAFHVHDEIVVISRAGAAERELEILIECMSAPVDWAPGLLLGAEGYVAERYRKG